MEAEIGRVLKLHIRPDGRLKPLPLPQCFVRHWCVPLSVIKIPSRFANQRPAIFRCIVFTYVTVWCTV